MDIHQIKADLTSANSQQRLKAVTQLRQYDAEIAVPLLKSVMNDQEFIVRSFVAMGLGKKRTPESFSALLTLIVDRDANVRAEAANALSLYGEEAVSLLVKTFEQDPHWLVRRSILAAFADMNEPDALLTICLLGVQGKDRAIQEASIEGLGLLAATAQHDAALKAILAFANAEQWRLRVQVAKALGQFQNSSAQEALHRLRQDRDHRVVAATLEDLV